MGGSVHTLTTSALVLLKLIVETRVNSEAKRPKRFQHRRSIEVQLSFCRPTPILDKLEGENSVKLLRSQQESDFQEL